MFELRLLSFAVLIFLVLMFEWRVIISPRLLRLYFRRYSIRLLLLATVVSAMLFAVLSRSSTPMSDAAVFLLVGTTLVLATCLLGFAYKDYFGPRIDRRFENRLRMDQRKTEGSPNGLRLKGRHYKQVAQAEELPFIDVEIDHPSET